MCRLFIRAGHLKGQSSTIYHFVNEFKKTRPLVPITFANVDVFETVIIVPETPVGCVDDKFVFSAAEA